MSVIDFGARSYLRPRVHPAVFPALMAQHGTACLALRDLLLVLHPQE